MKKKDQEAQLYQIVLSQFTDARNRTEYLTGRAHNLLEFDGIINSIQVVLITLVARDESSKEHLYSSPYFLYLKWFVVLVFLCYILSSICALLSFRITRYKRAPTVQSGEFIQKVSTGEAELSMPHLIAQIFEAFQFTDEINRKKYNYLFAATALLLLAIVCTAVMWVLVFASI
jgi:hypothetical protein